MLRSWLSEAQHQVFLHARAAGLPYSCTPELEAREASFEWTLLERVLAEAPAPAVLVVRRNELLARPSPRGAAAVRALFAEGTGMVVQRAERYDAGLRSLAEAFERELSGSAHIQLFVTPASTHGFGWHFDAEDVCILQTLGTKKYYFRANTRPPASDEARARPDFAAIRDECSPTMTCVLERGDVLYLPRYMWHVARAVSDSFSISLGLR